MMKLHFKFILCVMIVCLVGIFTDTAAAQTSQDIVLKNRQAMEYYGNLEIESALDVLESAKQECLDNNLTGEPLARTFSNMGMVEFGGNGNSAAAMELFKKALCQDATILLDPMNTTPDMDMLFKAAKAQVDSQGCDGIGPVTAAEKGESTVDDLLDANQPSETNVSAPSEIVNDVLRHTPVTQQKRLIPIPFLVVTNPDIEVVSVVAFYRTVGERIFQKLPLVSKSEGWSAYIECDVLTTLDPTAIEYYIAVTDEAGQLLSTAGSEAQPFTIQISESVTTPPPAIPGESPLPACKEECPPWNPDCNATDCARYADLCSEAEPCCSGMACKDGVCVEAGGDFEDGEFVNTKGANTKVRLYLNGGIGFGFLPGAEYSRSDFPNMRSETPVKANPGLGFSKLHARLGAMFALTEKFELGLNFRADLPLYAEFYDTLVPSIIANAAYRIAGTNAEKGFQMFGVIGFGWVQIMHRIPFKDCRRYATWDESNDRPLVDSNGNETSALCLVDDWKQDSDEQVMTSGFRKEGFLGAELGLDLNYWFVKNVGLNMGTIFDITFPENFTINLDVQLGLALRF